MVFEDLFPGENIESKEREFKGILNEGIDPKTGGLKQISWLKTIVAFANGNGGIMYVGIEDKSHTVVSLDAKTCDEQLRLIRREDRNRIEPYLDLDPIALPVYSEGKETRYIIKIEVHHSRVLPVMVKDRGAYFTFIRKYGETQIADSQAIRTLVLQSEDVNYDTMPTHVVYDPKDFASLEKEYALSHNGEKLEDKTLFLKGFFDDSRHLKRGSLLFKDDYDGDKTKLNIVKWPGINRGSSTMLSVHHLHGSVIPLIHEATSLVMSLSTNGIRKTSQGEEKYFSYPERSVMEGVANAIAHRNYWMVGSQIQIDLFIDRMEITSPGSLLNGKELSHDKNIASIIPQHRNPLIADILALVGMIQGLGTGFDKISEDYRLMDEAHQPYVSCDDSSFTLTLPDMTYDKGVIGIDNPMPKIFVDDNTLSPNEMKILSYCYPEKRTVADIAGVLNIKISSYLRDKLLAGLVKKGYLVQSDEHPKKYITSQAKVHLR